ncbi:MAG: hypothetical protein QM699_12575 [Amaricoccus sp.]|uniref:hypothetical protein n=1 Tax=Amaricoccus sp. TaxID=1872485 RepID=UPI0039E3143B
MTTTVFSSSVSSAGIGPVFIYKASGDGLVVNAGVTLSSGFTAAVAREGLTGLQATINGTLAATVGIDAYGASLDLTVGSEGSTGGINASADSSVWNHGSIRGLHLFDVTEFDRGELGHPGRQRGPLLQLRLRPRRCDSHQPRDGGFLVPRNKRPGQ